MFFFGDEDYKKYKGWQYSDDYAKYKFRRLFFGTLLAGLIFWIHDKF